MKIFNTLFIVLSLAIAVSCGGDKKSKSSGLSSNPYRVSTITGYYSPTQSKMYQVYYDGKWYQLQPAGPSSQTELQTVYQATYQAYNQGTGNLAFHSIPNGSGGTIGAYRVQLTGSLGYAGMPQQGYQQGVQQPVNSGSFSFLTIKLY